MTLQWITVAARRTFDRIGNPGVDKEGLGRSGRGRVGLMSGRRARADGGVVGLNGVGCSEKCSGA